MGAKHEECAYVVSNVLWSSYDHTWFSGPDEQEIFIFILNVIFASLCAGLQDASVSPQHIQ
jgi:hypothetical protein